MVGRNLRMRALAVALVAATTVSACGVDATDDARGAIGTEGGGGGGGDTGVIGSGIEETTTTEPTTTTAPPPVDVDVIGDDGSELNQVAAGAIVEIEDYWSEVYPDVYGSEYEPVSGGFFAVDAGTDPTTLPCAPPEIDLVLYNAYYCPPDDAVAWDQEGLFPDIAEQFGEFAVAVVLAHEWGHAIQARAEVDEPTVITELQADCFAGAWVRHVRDDDGSRFDVSTGVLDDALAGILSLKDAPGSLATDPNAHGSGFDRVGAFQEGYQQSAERCAEYTDGDPVPYQFPFSDADLVTGGDLAFADETDPETGEVVQGIESLAFESLELYWADVFPELGGDEWRPLAPPRSFTPDDPPTCDGEEVTSFRLFYCVPDDYVGYDGEETLPDAAELGDFAAGYLFGTQYGLAVQEQLDIEAPDEITATLRGDCYAGAWAGALLPTEVNQEDFPYTLLLSPGDLDEAVAVLLTFRSESDRDRQGPGFERVAAFRSGVVDGPEECTSLEAE